jgi:hypothetical protein
VLQYLLLQRVRTDVRHCHRWACFFFALLDTGLRVASLQVPPLLPGKWLTNLFVLVLTALLTKRLSLKMVASSFASMYHRWSL